jgi:hypothetical protein
MKKYPAVAGYLMKMEQSSTKRTHKIGFVLIKVDLKRRLLGEVLWMA